MNSLFGDSLGKQAVREFWNTPVLRYLNEQYGLRYRYLGLPGTKLIDVKLWKDMIDEVVAFEVKHEPTDEDPEGRRGIIELRKSLRLLNIPSFRAYFGPMEEVILLRHDYDATEYTQENLVTIFNLDFCDEISSKVETRQSGKKMWRFEVIRQLMQDQKQCFRQNPRDNLFVCLITIRNQIHSDKIKGFLGKIEDSETKKYVDHCEGIMPIPKGKNLTGSHTWALKAFLYDTIKYYCGTPHISALFFPTIKYIGHSKSSPMLHFMFLGRFENEELHRPSFLPDSYLSTIACTQVNNEQTIIWHPEPGELNLDANTPSSLEYLKEYESGFIKIR